MWTLLALGCLLYLPGLATAELSGEEGRRAIPAREMLASGDYVVPTIWGEWYLNKPPLMFWAIAAVGNARGTVDEFATRLPSALATVLTALAILWWGWRNGSRRAGWIAGAMFLCTPLVFEKGAFGEIEALFALEVFAATALFWRDEAAGRGREFLRTTLCAIAVAAALLTKGPAAFPFLAGAAAGLVATGGGRSLVSARLWLPVLGGVLLAALAWVWPLLERIPFDDAWATLTREVRRGPFRWGVYLKQRGETAAGLLVGAIPASAVCLLALRTEVWQRTAARPASRYALVCLVASVLVFALLPGLRTRYLYPVVPWICLLGARLLDEQMCEPAAALDRRLRAIGLLVGLAGTAAAGAAALALFVPLGPLDGMTPPGALLAAGLAAVSVRTAVRWRAGTVSSLALGTAAILAILRLLQLSEVDPATGDRHGRAATGARIARALPPDAPVRNYVPGAVYNDLFYVGRALPWIDNPATAAAGDVVLVAPDTGRDLLAAHPDRYELVLEADLSRGRAITALRVR